MKPCLIEWLDAAVTEDRWSDLDDAITSCKETLIPCKTLGFLFIETGVGTPKHTLHLTQTDGFNQIGPITHIPVCSIISQREFDIERREDAKSRNSQERQKSRKQNTNRSTLPVTGEGST